MSARLLQSVCVASLVLWTGAAWAVDPIGADKFNVATQIDLFKVNRGNFADMVTPVAKKENGSELIFYDFADNFCDLMAEKAATFTKDTGIPVKHVCVEGDAATQQVIAAKQAGQPAPVDVFFGPNGQVRAMTLAGAIANIPLVDLLPNAGKLDDAAARRSRGYEHGGTVVPFHRNQTSLAYNSATIKDPPQTIDALFQLAASQGFKVAITNPTEGGSGSGFIESLMLAMAPDCKNDLYDFSIDEAKAKATAARCMAPVIKFINAQKDHITFTNGNTESLQAIADGVVPIATVWEDDLYSQAAKGLMPPTVKPYLLQSGEVGDGDGVFITASTTKAEASLLFVNYLMSDDVQVAKMEEKGSRTARLDLEFTNKIPDKLAKFLVPDDEYRSRTRPRINGLITDAASDLFAKDVIAAQ
jgi:putative spermidine/putrescine transport system substrate-binding protein